MEVVTGDWNSLSTVKFYVPEINEEDVEKDIFFFDFEGTIVSTLSGREPQNIVDPNDWIFFPGVVDTLTQIASHSQIVAIACNYTFGGGESERCLLSRSNSIISFLRKRGVDPFFFISTGRDKYRKPETGCFSLLHSILKSNYSIEISKVVHIGDSAGESESNPKYRNSDVDYQFYTNVESKSGVENLFYTPQEIFPHHFKINFAEGEVILLLGNPCCGKTTLAEELESEGYFVIESEMSLEKKKNLLRKRCALGESIVIDGSFPSVSERSGLLSIAEEFGYVTKIYFIITDGRNYNRSSTNKKRSKDFECYSKKFCTPTEDEADVIEILI